jgi:multidrug efflux pump subunit AcrB
MRSIKPVAAVCALTGLLVLSMLALGSGAELPPKRDFFVVSIKQYGVDAREMERTVTIPLEDALYALSQVKSVSSVTENAQSRVSVMFKRGGSAEGREERYIAVSGAAARVYERLPASAQRPEILSEDGQAAPVWTAAVRSGGSAAITGDAAFARFLERTVKPALQSLHGAARVEIAGLGLPEIVIALDNRRCAALGLSPNAVALNLARDDGLWPSGTLAAGGGETTITVDGRYQTLDELRGAFIPVPGGAAIRLDTVARVIEQERTPDIISRLNGEKTALISVTAESGGNEGILLWRLSKRLAQKTAEWTADGITFEVLVDRGAEEGRAWRSLAIAAAGGALLTALLVFLLTGFAGSGRTAAVCAFSVPVMCVLSMGLLAALSRPVDQAVLAGLTAGSGAAVDAAILVTGHWFRKKPLKTLFGPIFAGSATTVAALLPLFVMETARDEVKTIALCIAVITAAAFPVSFILLPPLLGCGRPGARFRSSNRRGKQTRLCKHALRLFARLVFIVVTSPKRSIACCMLPVLAAAAVSGWQGNKGREVSAESVYAQVEFEGGLPIAESDARLSQFAETLLTNPGITHIETAAKSGRGNVSVSFDPKVLKPSQVRRLLRETEAEGGFVYIGEETAGERNWRITIFGADDRVCRELARKMAGACAGLPVVEEAVLHFKDGGPRRTLRPRRETLSRLQVMFVDLADTARRAVHAPVAYKRLSPADRGDGAAETDVRIRTETVPEDNTAQTGETEPTETAPASLAPQADALMSLRITAVNRKTGTFEMPALLSLVEVEDGVEIASISREDRRRTASLGVRTQPLSARSAQERILSGLPIAGMPAGYTVVFDREAIEAEEALRKSIFYFALSLFFCYIVLAAAAESFTLPFLPLLAAPPSLALPFLAMTAGGFPVNGAAVCAFIAVTGITINAGVLSVDALKTAFNDRAGTRMGVPFPRVYRALRGRLGELLATSATSASAALPFLFLREDSNTAVRMLAYVSAFGVTGSAIMSVTLIPALWVLCYRRRQRVISCRNTAPQQ